MESNNSYLQTNKTVKSILKNNSQKQPIKIPLGKEKIDQKYIFSWQSNCGPYSINKKEAWKHFDEGNQIHLNKMYQEFFENSRFYTFNLLPPANDCAINLKKMLLYNFDTNCLQKIKVEMQDITFQMHQQIYEIKTDSPNKNIPVRIEQIANIDEEEEKNKLFSPFYKKEELIFIKKINKQTSFSNKQASWAPFDLEIESKLNEAYEEYLKDKQKKFFQIDSLENEDLYFNFSKMIQINKNGNIKSNTIQRWNPKFLFNLERENRYNDSKELIFTKSDKIEHLTLNQKEFKSFLINSKKEKVKKKNKILFKVFPEFTCEIEIEEDLFSFDNLLIIDNTMQEMKSILFEEINSLSKKEGLFPKSRSFETYRCHLEKINDYKSFFEEIIFIYTMEGYLFRKLNDFLKDFNRSELENIKYYFTCLLASIQFFSCNSNLNKNEDLMVYRASQCSEGELQEYLSQNLSTIFYVCKNFLSTCINDAFPKNFLCKNDDCSSNNIKLFWEIKIPKEIMSSESRNFADISIYSQFPGEKEILIRNGAIIQINKITPYIGNKNKFIINCTIKSFSLSFFSKVISLDPSIKHLILKDNNLGDDQINIFI